MNYLPTKFGGRTKGPKEKKQVLFTEKFWAQFKDEIKKNDKGKDGADKKQSNSKAMLLKSMFDKHACLQTGQISACLLSEFSNNDITKAYELIRYFTLCEEGHLVTNNSFNKLNKRIKLEGAENWGNVMCYLDSLLFSMFAKLESFEPLLLSFDDKQEDEKVQRLRAILRLYVSLLRSGKKITYDLTRLLCQSLAENGFKAALSRKQEDSCDLFIFLTELLSMPLLTLKIDIAHGGKEAAKDDHRFTKERMLYVSIPSEDDEINKTSTLSKNQESVDPLDKVEEEENLPQFTDTDSTKAKAQQKESKESKEASSNSIPKDANNYPEESILLEECLEHYFNNSIHVKRQLERRLSMRRNTITQLGSLREDDLTISSDDGEKPSHQHVEDCPKSPLVNENTIVENTRDVDQNSHDGESSQSEEPSLIDYDDYDHVDKGIVTYQEVSPKSINANKDGSSTQLISPRRESFTSNKSSYEGLTKRHSRTQSISKDSLYNINVAARSRANSSVSIFSENKNGEVSLPAWMFLQLLPFYTDLEPKSQTEQSFAEKRPILPICLKRYTFGTNSKKNNKRVIIPSFIDLPNFIADDARNGVTSDSDNDDKFRLVLESVVCHRGDSIDSGHFISIVRDEPFDAHTTEEAEDSKRWLLFDDLAESERVKPITFKKAVATEIPYILFYRMESFTEPIKRKQKETELLNQVVAKVNELKSDNTETLNEKLTALHLENHNKLDNAKVDSNKLDNVKIDNFVKVDNNKIDWNQTPPFLAQSMPPPSASSLAPPSTSHSLEPNTLKANNSRKKSDTSTFSDTSVPSNTSDLDSAAAPSKKSHDLFSKMVFYNSTYPYPNSADYIDIREKFYWKLKTEDNGYYEEVLTPNIFIKNVDVVSNSSLSSKAMNKRNSSIMSDNFSNKSLYSDDESFDLAGAKEEIIQTHTNPSTNVYPYEEMSKSGKLYRMNSSVGSLWSRRKKNLSKKRSKSDLLDNSDSRLKPVEVPDTKNKETKNNINVDETENESTLSTPTFSAQAVKPVIFQDNGHLSPQSSSAVRSPRSSYENPESRGRALYLTETEKSRLKSPRRKSVPNGNQKTKVKKKNEIKAKRERYRDEKCLVM